MKDFIKLFLCAFFGLLLGNYLGDQATLKNCGASGQADMLWDDLVITCKIKPIGDKT